MRPDGTVARLREALLADSFGAVIGALLWLIAGVSLLRLVLGN
jgi:hypothetical protein